MTEIDAARPKAEGYRGSVVHGFLRNLRRFAQADAGLVTLEWVALAAAVVVGGIVLVWLIVSNIKGDARSVGSGISNAATTPVTQNSP